MSFKNMLDLNNFKIIICMIQGPSSSDSLNMNPRTTRHNIISEFTRKVIKFKEIVTKSMHPTKICKELCESLKWLPQLRQFIYVITAKYICVCGRGGGLLNNCKECGAVCHHLRRHIKMQETSLIGVYIKISSHAHSK